MGAQHIHVKTVGVSTLLTVKESLTHETCRELERVYKQVVARNRNRIIIDFKAVPFLDSQALDLLLAMHDGLASSGGVLKIFGLTGLCRDILIATRLVTLLHIYPDLQEALRGEV